jgi:hypothetical protein
MHETDINQLRNEALRQHGEADVLMNQIRNETRERASENARNSKIQTQHRADSQGRSYLHTVVENRNRTEYLNDRKVDGKTPAADCEHL